MNRQQRMISRMIARTDKTEKLLREQIKQLQELVKVLEQFEPADHYNNRNRIS